MDLIFKIKNQISWLFVHIYNSYFLEIKFRDLYHFPFNKPMILNFGLNWIQVKNYVTSPVIIKKESKENKILRFSSLYI